MTGYELIWSWLAVVIVIFQPVSLTAATWNVTTEKQLQQALTAAPAGDKVVLAAGVYQGNFILPRGVELTAESGAVLDGRGQGHVLQIDGAGSYVHHLNIRNGGVNLTDLNSGIFISRTAKGVRLEQNTLQGGGFGIWVDAAADVQIVANRIQGDQRLRSADRGNGIHLFNVTGASVRDNEVWHSRDGIYIDTSNQNELIGNYLHDLRYGVHYMYSYNNRVEGNHTENTRTGYALMQSKYLQVMNNRSTNDANYGILMNYITDSKVIGNRVEGVENRRNPHMQKGSARGGLEGKALFIYNSLFNEIRSNLFARSDMGIHLTAGSESNLLSGNAFVSNREQVKYVANRAQDWSEQGAGNYWSDYLGWDMDGDGVGDLAYEPNDSVDQLLWKYPSARLLLNSPAVETLRWVQRQFPVLKSAGVRDSYPLMRVPAALQRATENSDGAVLPASSVGR